MTGPVERVVSTLRTLLGSRRRSPTEGPRGADDETVAEAVARYESRDPLQVRTDPTDRPEIDRVADDETVAAAVARIERSADDERSVTRSVDERPVERSIGDPSADGSADDETVAAAVARIERSAEDTSAVVVDSEAANASR